MRDRSPLSDLEFFLSGQKLMFPSTIFRRTFPSTGGHLNHLHFSDQEVSFSIFNLGSLYCPSEALIVSFSFASGSWHCTVP